MLKQASLLWAMMLGILPGTFAQPVLTPQNVALGGGGSTYITDYNANFYNPANLFISDRIRNVDIGLAISGTYFNGVQNFSNIEQQQQNLELYLQAFEPGHYSVQNTEIEEILEDNFIRNRTTSLHQARLDVTLLGMKFRTENRAFSLAIRSRTSSSFEIGRGWYSSEFQQVDDESVLDRTLIHRYQTLYEVSLGMAESFKFFTDMTPRLDEFSIGIAPKLVLAGAYQQAEWRNKYIQTQQGLQHIQQFEYTATGSIDEATTRYLNNDPAETALSHNTTQDLFDIQGIGAGMDIGFTYLITLGSDLSTIADNQRTQKSLRIAFSITDIGFVSYDSEITGLEIAADTGSITTSPTFYTASQTFVGAPGQFLSFVDSYSVNNPFMAAQAQQKGRYVMLPTALHSGILFEINRLKLMGDLSIGLTNNAFNTTKLVASAGIELRPLPFLPLRAGTQLATELPSFFSFGTAIETKIWDLSIATQFVSRTFSENPTLAGVTMAAFQFHF